MEINARVVYRISISYANRIPTELVALAGEGAATPPGEPGSDDGPSHRRRNRRCPPASGSTP